MENTLSKYGFDWDGIAEMPTLQNVDGQELKVEEDNIRVWMISDNEVHIETRFNNAPGWSTPVIVLRHL